MGGKAEIRGLTTVIANMEQITAAVQQHLRSSAQQASGVLDQAVKDKASLACHSLKDLAALGHPYSTRLGVDSFSHPDEMVHTQSGQLLSSIEKVVEVSGNRVVVMSGVKESKVPYIGYLIDGTSKMRSRDFLGWAFQESADTIVRILKYGIVAGLGSRGGRM